MHYPLCIMIDRNHIKRSDYRDYVDHICNPLVIGDAAYEQPIDVTEEALADYALYRSRPDSRNVSFTTALPSYRWIEHGRVFERRNPHGILDYATNPFEPKNAANVIVWPNDKVILTTNELSDMLHSPDRAEIQSRLTYLVDTNENLISALPIDNGFQSLMDAVYAQGGDSSKLSCDVERCCKTMFMRELDRLVDDAVSYHKPIDFVIVGTHR